METPTTRTDRAAEASAEAERRYPESWDHYNDEPVDDWGYSECQREAFCAGMAWADANPQPTTITRGGYEHAKRMFGISPAETRQFLRALGIEVEGDE